MKHDCSVERCDRSATRLGFCSAHYAQMKKHGRITYAAIGAQLPDRFWAKVDKSGGPDACWPWKARLDRAGYGRGGSRTETLAHRFAWTLQNGPIPSGMFICHHCDNPPCCNPGHLFVGTPDDNVQDCLNKGRRDHTGESNQTAKLTAEQVRSIRAAYKRGVPSRRIAQEFGINKSTAWKVGSGRSWAALGDGTAPPEHDPDPEPLEPSRAELRRWNKGGF